MPLFVVPNMLYNELFWMAHQVTRVDRLNVFQILLYHYKSLYKYLILSYFDIPNIANIIVRPENRLCPNHTWLNIGQYSILELTWNNGYINYELTGGVIVISCLVVAVLAISIGSAATSLAMTMMPGNQAAGKIGNMNAASNMTGSTMKSKMTSGVKTMTNSSK
jgi:hypothetical protein